MTNANAQAAEKLIEKLNNQAIDLIKEHGTPGCWAELYAINTAIDALQKLVQK